MRATISRIPRNERSPLARTQALSYLKDVLARREANTRGVDEAPMLDTAGHLACTSAANLVFAGMHSSRRAPSRGFCQAPCAGSCWSNWPRRWA
jgi:hypothetical protein